MFETRPKGVAWSRCSDMQCQAFASYSMILRPAVYHRTWLHFESQLHRSVGKVGQTNWKNQGYKLWAALKILSPAGLHPLWVFWFWRRQFLGGLSEAEALGVELDGNCIPLSMGLNYFLQCGLVGLTCPLWEGRERAWPSLTWIRSSVIEKR